MWNAVRLVLVIVLLSTSALAAELPSYFIGSWIGDWSDNWTNELEIKQKGLEVPGMSCDIRSVQYVSKQRNPKELDVNVDLRCGVEDTHRGRHDVMSAGCLRCTILVGRKCWSWWTSNDSRPAFFVTPEAYPPNANYPTKRPPPTSFS